MTKIYDCFTFYNELDLLDIRLQELYDKVDHFVIVESNQTFTGRSKPFLFEDNKSRYSKYLDKIIHVRVTDMPGGSDPWDNERHQRNAIMQGLNDANPNDIIIVSDADEIPRSTVIDTIRNSTQSVFGLRMPLFNFKFNYMRVSPGEYDCWAMACTKQVLDNGNTPDQLRNHRHSLSGCAIIEHAGWHWSFLGNDDYLRDKASSFSHQEINTPEFVNNISVEKSIANRQHWGNFGPERYAIVNIDNYFPDTIKNYPQFILDTPETDVYNLLSKYL